MEPPPVPDWLPNVFYLFLWIAFFLLTDTFIYGLLVPITGAYIGSSLAAAWDLRPMYEIVLVILSVYLIFYAIFYTNWESTYWKHLFAQDLGYISVLMIRDALNMGILILSLNTLYHAVEGIARDRSVKPGYLGQGIGYVFWNGVGEWGFPIPQAARNHYSLTYLQEEESFYQRWGWWELTPSISDKNLQLTKMIHAAQFILAIAGVTASIMKLIYFNTLHTYARAMEMFLILHNGDIETSKESSLANSEYVSDFSIASIKGTGVSAGSVKNTKHFEIDPATYHSFRAEAKKNEAHSKPAGHQ